MTAASDRWWLRPRSLWLHGLLLAVVLAGVAGVIGPHGRYTSDEGAVLITARSVAAGHGWLVDRPLRSVDPTGAEFPLVSADLGSKGVSAYAKHPTYPFLLAGAQDLWPDGGVVAVSVVATIAAALLSASLAARLDPRLAVGTFWLVGVASPLLVDSQLVMAHTLGAALAVGAVLAADSARVARRRAVVPWVAAVAVAMALLVLVRTEGIFLAPGLALGAVLALRAGRARAAAVSLAALGGAVAGLAVDRVARRAIVGNVLAFPDQPAVDTQGFLSGRVSSMFTTLLRPGYLGGVGALLLVAMGISLLISTAALVRRRPDATMALVFAVVAAGAAVARAVAVPSDSVPGLLVAFPASWIGLAALGRGAWSDERRRLVLSASLVSVLGVVATQYGVGGTVEWGGRYFAFVLPVLAPLVVAGLASLRGRFEPNARPLAAGAFAVVVLALAVLGVRDQRTTERGAETFTSAVTAAGRQAGPGKPVLVTTQGIVPRLAWKTFPRQRWLLADADHPDHLVARLRRAGIHRFVLVTDDPRRDAPVARGATERSESVVLGWRLQLYET